MHGLSRLGNGNGNGVSPPSSPRFRHGRNNNKNNGSSFRTSTSNYNSESVKLQKFVEKLGFMIVSFVYKRRGLLLFAPLLYISGMLLYMGILGFDGSTTSDGGVPPRGSLYRSPQVFQKLWPFMEAEYNGSSNLCLSQAQVPEIFQDIYPRINGKGWGERLFDPQWLTNMWTAKLHQVWKPCIAVSQEGFTELPKSNGYLIIEANGGLNQQRLSICDAVAVAGLLNATLVVPIFHLNSVWRDSSKFGDIFDEDFFKYALRNHVKVVKELPEDVLRQFDYNISSIVNLRVKAWSSPTYYLQKVLPKLKELGAVRIAPFSNRLAHSVLPTIQGLRCLCNFEALRFSEPIRMLAAKMVDRMVKKSSSTSGRYVSVHLRFEEDMVAFSCCIYDGGEEEKSEMDIARERSWRGKFRRRGRVIRPGANRVDGKCPLTPLEVGMMLRGMGFDNNTSVYVAAGKIYKAEKYMTPLKQMFPRLESKDALATIEELAPFEGHSSRLAALDYTVCLYSEAFVTTQGGNFPHFLVGHRRYLNEGHAKTIKPDKRKLALLFDNPDIRWNDFKRQLQDMLHHSDVKGIELKKPSSSLYTFPMPDCMCKQVDVKRASDNQTRLL